MFSVIIPAYNSENTIEKALDSLRNQTKPELIREVIVINDGSADATADKVEQYKKRESCNLNIILYNQQNAGVAAARNAGIRMATADYLAFLDSDDCWAPEKLEWQEKNLKENPQIDLLCGGLEEGPLRIFLRKDYLLHRLSLKEYCTKSVIFTSTVVIRRARVKDAGYFDGMSDLNAGIKSANSGATQLKAGIDQLSTGAGQLSAGSKQLKAGLGTLSTGLNTLSISVGSFSTYKEGTLCSSLYALNLNAGKLQKEGTAVLQSGLSQLTANNDTLKSGASQLADGTATLKDSSGTLADGVTQLNEGAITLKDGMAQFNSEAIAVDTIKAVVKAGQEYNSFLGKSDDKAGSVTFVYKTAGITANK